ncbi:NAD-dependent glycerol-3-phosphate dehydrogenase C-terminus-domain-containing protein [Phakopsora pachyrhizi]|uniref:Glycerol-3-phosphate dehydrogenase [NAD(+)] n=1 Tax=Phakopsora pachyrhizi TaxID=170000 RepID=A0AAV0B3B8_PHAPC|nr:NAD-dependent glycerol-3-phosphate dehydrogenase C-terminus-domain-containing protein [Phakopsora pachyrhizi]CAH7681027.1 NAD-dependent glycerol-3-phosphate dehydrogenase C-terminus-domain-containing protein [Phakopsora pachyrhizi]
MASSNPSPSNSLRRNQKHKVSIVGSGNWGSAIAKLAAENARRHSDLFEREVPMWVFEEKIEGRNLTSIINEQHENVKYLPGVFLPENLKAVPSLIDACRSATMLVICLPHQFIPGICKQLREAKVIGPGAFAISLTKGVDVVGDRIKIFADVIEEDLGISCCALSGANIANEVALNKFSETTVGYRQREEGELWQKLFHTPQFHVQIIEDRVGVSLCGALKNVVAVAAGFCDGLGWGNNAKAAIMRIGLLEMKNFSMEFFSGVKAATFVEESAGVADLITTCFGGRNRLCAEAFVKTGKTFQQLEDELLGGQKLQGVATAAELHTFLKARGRVGGYPLFNVVYKIAYESLHPTKMTSHL